MDWLAAGDFFEALSMDICRELFYRRLGIECGPDDQIMETARWFVLEVRLMDPDADTDMISNLADETFTRLGRNTTKACADEIVAASLMFDKNSEVARAVDSLLKSLVQWMYGDQPVPKLPAEVVTHVKRAVDAYLTAWQDMHEEVDEADRLQPSDWDYGIRRQEWGESGESPLVVVSLAINQRLSRQLLKNLGVLLAGEDRKLMLEWLGQLANVSEGRLRTLLGW